MHDETKAIHTPQRRGQGAVAPPIQLTTTFEHGPAGEDLYGHQYIRTSNPNVSDLEARLTAMEGADDTVAFASGVAAGTAVLAGLKPGSRVVFHKDLYFDFRRLAAKVLPDWGIACESVDLGNEAQRQSAFSAGVDLVWFESPSNPLIDVLDIAAICRDAQKQDAQVLIDGTFATPVVQKPIALGVDYVLHSLTKYMGGHSDVQGGAIAYRGEARVGETLRDTRRLTGGVLAPFNAWLISRGLQTLHCRMERHCANAQTLAETLATHRGIDRVRYPFLTSHPGYDIAKQQMSCGGGMLSIEIAGGKQAALKVASKLKLFTNATSLGGVESLIEHRESLEGAWTDTPDNLLRLSVGLENSTDLLEDLHQALMP